MSEAECFLWLFLAILASPFIALWAVIAAITYVCTGGRIGWDWWDELQKKVQPKMSGRFWSVLWLAIVATDIVLICGGFTRYLLNHNIRVGEEVPLTWESLGNQMTLKKNLIYNTWRWNYGNEDIDAEHMCPTFGRNHDAVVKVDGKVQASTDGQWLQSFWQYDLLDHTGAKVYTVKATSGKAAIMEYLGLELSVVILDLEGKPVAYVAGDSFIVDDFTMKDAAGTDIIKFHRNIASLEAWKWEIKAVSDGAAKFKPVFAAVLAAHHAFADSDLYPGRNRTDMCNWWFTFSTIFLIVGASLMVFWLFAAYYFVVDFNKSSEPKQVPALNAVYVDYATQKPQMQVV